MYNTQEHQELDAALDGFYQWYDYDRHDVANVIRDFAVVTSSGRIVVQSDDRAYCEHILANFGFEGCYLASFNQGA